MSVLLWIFSLLAVVWGYSYLWCKVNRGKVHFSIRVDDARLIAGDESEIWIGLENRSWLPIPWVEVWQSLPDGTTVKLGDQWQEEITFRTFLLPKQRVQRRYMGRFLQRGMHAFSKAEVNFGDGIGLKAIHEVIDVREQIVVRPQLLPALELPVRLEELIGQRSIQRWYQEDTSRLMGVRPYMQGDLYKHIHWAATAKSGDLMVKQFDTTSETDLYVVLNVQFFDPYWMGSISYIAEYMCRLAASIMYDAEEKGYSYGFHTNATWRGYRGLHVPIDRTSRHLETMMNSIGAVSARAACPFEEILEGMRGKLNDSSTLVILTACWSEEVAVSIDRLRGEGHRLIMIACNDIEQKLTGLSPSIPIIPLHISDPDSDDGVREGESA